MVRLGVLRFYYSHASQKQKNIAHVTRLTEVYRSRRLKNNCAWRQDALSVQAKCQQSPVVSRLHSIWTQVLKHLPDRVPDRALSNWATSYSGLLRALRSKLAVRTALNLPFTQVVIITHQTIGNCSTLRCKLNETLRNCLSMCNKETTIACLSKNTLVSVFLYHDYLCIFQGHCGTGYHPTSFTYVKCHVLLHPLLMLTCKWKSHVRNSKAWSPRQNS